MASNNKIGIEVQVKFPTVEEMKADLAKKWQSVKNGFDAKVNVSVDEKKLASMKKRIREALKEETFHLKIDADSAIKSIQKVKTSLKELDSDLKKVREVKINFNVADMDKTMKELIAGAKSAENAMKGQKDVTKSNNDELDKTVAKVNKIQQAYKQLKDGSYSVTTKTTGEDDKGNKVTRTERPNGNVDFERIENRQQDLKEIEDMMKRIHQISKQQMTADQASNAILEREKQIHQEVLANVKQEYEAKHKVNASEDARIVNLQRIQQAEMQVLQLSRQSAQAEKEIADAISRVVQLERQKNAIALKMVSAKEQEKQSLQEQLQYYERIQNKLKETHSLEEKMSSAQKAELNNLKNISELEVKRAEAKQKDAELAQKEANALRDMQENLKKVHSLELQILQIRERMDNGGSVSSNDRARLQILENELDATRHLQRETELLHTFEGNITDDMQRQLRLQEQIHAQERQRVQEASRIQAENDKITQKMKEYEAVVRNIGQLQRDLSYAGTRERGVIEQELNSEKEKLATMRQELETANALTSERRREIDAIEKAQQEQLRLNRARQQARDKDKEYGNSAEIVDPYSFMANIQQGAMAVFEPVKRLDEALIGVMKVADATGEQFKEFAETSYDVGSSLGVSADEYILATEKWVTAGKNFKESQELAKISLVGSFVGNIKPDDMVKYMSVPLNAFEKEGLKANDVINIMNETSNNHAVEMTELGKAYMRSSGSIKDAGVGFKDLTGLITGAQEATRMGGERIGTALKTIGINYNNIKGKISEGEGKKFDMLKSYGIDLDQTNSLMDALDLVAQKKDELSDVQMNEIMYRLAGKEHQNILSGIVDQWERVKKVSAEASEQIGQGENGSAYLEHAKQADSVKFKLAELKNTWDKLMLTIGGSTGGISKVLGMLTEGLEVLTALAGGPLMEAFKYIFAGVAIHAGASLYKRFFDGMVTGFGSVISRGRETIAMMGDLKRSASTSTSGSRGRVTAGAGATRTTTSSRRGTNSARNRSRNRQNDDDDARQRANNAQRINEAEQGAERANSKLKQTGKLMMSLAGFIPLVGDALLVLDLMGVPVFDKMGQMIKGATTSTKELSKALEDNNKKLQANNSILNGGATKKMGNYNGLQDQYNKGKGDKGYLDNEQFTQFQSNFNQMTEDMGIDIKIEMNDTAEIEGKLAQLKEKLLEVQQVDLTKLGEEGFKKDMGSIEDARARIAEEQGWIKEYTEDVQEYQKVVDELNAKKASQGGFLSADEFNLLQQAQGKVDEFNGKIRESQGVITEQKGLIGQATSNIEGYTNKLITFINNGGSLKGMNHESIKLALGSMIEGYNGLQDSIGLADGAQKQLSSSTQIQGSEWKALQSQFPALKQFHVDQVNGSEQVRQKASEVIGKEKEKMQATQNSTKTAIDGASAEVGMKAEIDQATGKIITTNQGLKEELKGVKEQANAKIEDKNISWTIKLVKAASDLWKWVTGGFSSTKEIEVPVKPTEAKSVSAVTSSNVSSFGGGLIKSPATVGGAVVSNDESSTSNPNATVNSDVWRYWSRETYGIDDTDSETKALTTAMNKSNENQAQLIKLYGQQQTLLKRQINNYSSLYGAKDNEMNETLNKLAGYGFRVDTNSNKVNNLEHSASLRGKDAEEAQKLLDTWKSLYNEMDGIQETMRSMGDQIDDINDKVEKAKITQEMERFEDSLKRIDALLQSVSNSDSLNGERLDLIGSHDREQELVETEKAMNQSKLNMSQLINEFNKLSTSSIQYKENGEKLEGTLKSMSSEILQQADAIMKYQQAINEIQFTRVAEDLGTFNDAIDDNTSRIKNNIDNLKEGLLSGTSLSDLESSTSTKLDLSRDNQYEKLAKERIALEAEVNQAMESFGKKNVDRATGIANAQLDITASMYNQMLQMQAEYANGNKSSANSIQSKFGDLSSIGMMDEKYDFVKKLDDSYDEVLKKQDALTAKFQSDMKKAISQQDKDALTNRYIIDNMKVQEEYFKASINGAKSAISDLKEQLKDSTLTDDQEEKIKKQIDDYEKGIIESQNKIKDSVKQRFEFEFSLLDKAMKDYEKLSNDLGYAMEILDAIGGENFDARGVLLGDMFDVEKHRNDNLSKTLEALKSQQAMYEKGSYEWSLINEEVDKYNKALQDSNKELLDMNKNIMSNSFSKTMEEIQKSMFNGKTLKQFKDYQELWMDGLEREIALEDAYKRMKDLGTETYKGKLQLLEKQEKLSKFEMDYLNKQLDVLELQQKLENLNKEKTVQTLKQNADGTWDWKYTADEDQLSQVQEELSQKQLELQKLEEQGREDYLSKLESILKDAESGNYKNIDDFKNAIGDLSDAYSSIVGDFPKISEEYLKDLIETYGKYVNESNDILNGSGVIPPDISVGKIQEGLSNEIVTAFKSISKELGDVFATALLAKIPNFGTPAQTKGVESKSVSISLEKVEFPNIKTAEGIKDAIMSLPQIALQKSKEK
ncbi:phage tail tape measure protein [Bacillus cereus]|nr:phage tail tape measure protein [Bacillus cereus]